MIHYMGGVACAPALHPPNRFGYGRCGERLPRPVACFAWPCFGGVRGSCDSELLIGLIKIEPYTKKRSSECSNLDLTVEKNYYLHNFK